MEPIDGGAPDDLGNDFPLDDGGYFSEHLGELAGDYADGEFSDEPGAAGETPVAAGLLTREQFQGSFKAILNGGSALSGLQSLAVPPDEEPAADGASSALYDLALDVPQLRFLIEPGNKYVGAAFAIGMFAVPKFLTVSGELKAKKAAKLAARSQGKPQARQLAEATNDNREPQPGIVTGEAYIT